MENYSKMRQRAVYVERYRAEAEAVMRSSGINAVEMMALTISATGDPKGETETGRLAWTILDSIFDEIERRVNGKQGEGPKF